MSHNAVDRIVSKALLSEKVARLVVEAPSIAKSRRAGHFVIVCVTDYSERVPYTIADADIDAGMITLIVQAVGKSSQRPVTLNVGDVIHDVVGPLGQATHTENFGTVVCAGGGVGMASLCPIVRVLKVAGNKVIVVAVVRTKELTILEKEFREFADEAIIVTDDGSYGTRGLVTGGAESVIKREKVDLCVTIGPAIMIKSVAPLTKKHNIPTTFSPNIIMVDGTGMCGACHIIVGGKTRFVCVDGPEFDVHQVDFDELPMRLNIYRR